MSEIAQILRQEIVREGVIPFARFMELALYCPDFGYYECGGRTPGRGGDFITSVSVGALFGQLLAAQFMDWMQDLGPGPLRLVEAGAHDGRLALDILAWLEGQGWPGNSRALEYWILEPSKRRRQWQASTLERFSDRVRWADSPESLGPRSTRGVIFSNELLDAFPVTRLRWNRAARHSSWTEVGVTFNNGDPEHLTWAAIPIEADRVSLMFADAGISIPPELSNVLPDGFTIDLAPGVTKWWAAAAAALERGVLMTIDYGLTALELLHPSRAAGTVRAYRRHRLEADVLAAPGEQDLTGHVNFSQVQRAGEAAGLRTEPIVRQAQFLTQIAGRIWGKASADESVGGGNEPRPEVLRQFQSLVHPEHLGHRFQVLIQRRG